MGKKWLKATHILLGFAVAAAVMPKGYVKAVNLGENNVDVVFTGNAEDIKEFEGVTASVDFYKIADAVEDPQYDTYGYDFHEGFETVLSAEEAASPTAETWGKAAERATALIFGEEPVEIEPVTVAFPLGEGETCKMESGLYLVVPYDEEGKPVMNEDGTVTSTISAGQHKYIYNPVIVTMPTTESRTDQSASTDWIWTNDITIVLKPEKTERLGQLKIVKSVRTFESRSAATFAFKVDAWMPDKVDENGNPTEYVYNNAVSMTFSPDDLSDQSVILDGIPVGAIVEVTEVYSGSSYKLVNTEYSNEEHVITVEDVLTVTFENEHTHEDRVGYGINNHYDKVDENWIWLDPTAEQGGDE